MTNAQVWKVNIQNNVSLCISEVQIKNGELYWAVRQIWIKLVDSKDSIWEIVLSAGNLEVLAV